MDDGNLVQVLFINIRSPWTWPAPAKLGLDIADTIVFILCVMDVIQGLEMPNIFVGDLVSLEVLLDAKNYASDITNFDLS